MIEKRTGNSAEETFEIGLELGRSLTGGEVILLFGGLGAGKTLFTKGILAAIDFDIDEVTSPSFALVNLYRARMDVYHVDLWRLDISRSAGTFDWLEDILDDERAVVIIEWAERLSEMNYASDRVIRVRIEGDGDTARKIEIEE
ncbi:MAG: tRNA (adenosine(37)-N6)-threonylcarbamoyltransferase complex ATPase subunit type 1 TsaE [Pyrinomonadaceae bacterium]